jgi:hypothetical protein
MVRVHGMPRCAKYQYCTCTRGTRDPITVGIPVPGPNPIDGFRDSKFDLHPSKGLDFSVVIGDGETAQDDVVEVDHRPSDNIRPFLVGERGCVRRVDD